MSGYGIEIMKRVGGVGTGISNADSIAERLDKAGGTESKDEKSFGNVLKSLVDDVKETQAVADKATEELVAGRSKDIHGAMIAMEKADVSLRLLTQVRNKVIDAYREIMRMQV